MMAHPKKANAAPEGTAPAEGGEILHWRRGMWPPALPRVRSPRRSGGSSDPLGDRRDARDEALGLALDLTASRLHLLFDPAAVLLYRPHGLVATLTQLALHAGPGALDLADRAVAGRRAAALELAQARVDALLEALELALGALASIDVRLGRVDHGVAGLEGRAHRDQQGAPGLGLDDLQGVQLRLGARLGGLAGGLAALRGVATTSRSGLLGRRLALCLGLSSHSLFAPGGLFGDLIRSKFGRTIPPNT